MDIKMSSSSSSLQALLGVDLVTSRSKVDTVRVSGPLSEGATIVESLGVRGVFQG